MRERLADLGEDALIARLIAGFPVGGLAVGPGDDCAVVDEGGERLRLLKADALVEGVHFTSAAEPERVGWKAVARVVSDFAAMGGRAEHLLVTVALREDTEARWVEGLYSGMRRCMKTHGAVLAGGETTAVPPGSAVVISVSGEGSVVRDELVLRSGGEPGHVLAVTGRLGGSLAGKHLDFTPRLQEGQWLGAHGASAMMDLSDGLAKDLPRLAMACGCGFVIDVERVPANSGCPIEEALSNGEDYELLVAMPAPSWAEVKDIWPEGWVDLTEIGRLVESGGSLSGGWEHFKRGL